MRLFELILVVALFFLLSYFLMYAFAFQSICDRYDYTRGADVGITKTMATCKDLPMCEIIGIQYDKNEVSNWSCERKGVEKFHLEYYKNYIKSKL